MNDQMLWMIVFQGVIFLPFLLFVFRGKWQFLWGTFSLFLAAVVTQKWAILALSGGNLVLPFIGLAEHQISLTIDSLSALMISLVNLVCLLGWIYGKGYLKGYVLRKSAAEIAWHYFNYIWLYLAMLFVVMLRDGFSFLFAWEIMSLASFFLVVFEYEKRENLEAAISYLIQMHAGMIFLLIGFILASGDGRPFGFEGIRLYMAQYNPFGLFLLFFIGFGLKAGFIPIHTWLPQAHPAAPSHISGVMSGIMIKMGIYGILRVMQSLQSGYMIIGILVLVVSIISSIGGISLASVQSDFKKVLAYSSIENMGIIGMGLGLGLVGLGTGIRILTLLGFTGSVFHMINHALFKPLLFFGAGNVYQQLHHRNMEKMGGLGKRMRVTAVLFMVGSIAISGIPPFNGFISELILYLGIFKTLNYGELAANVISLFVLAALVITGGLAVFTFTRLYSVVFQGHPRSEHSAQAREADSGMLTVMGFIVLLLLSIGILPQVWVALPLKVAASLMSGSEIQVLALEDTLQYAGMSALGLIVITTLLWYARRRHVIKFGSKPMPTWGCGYVTPTPESFQYTSSSQGYYMNLQAPFITGVHTEYKQMSEHEYFPAQRNFQLKVKDVIWQYVFYTPARFIASILQKMAIFHTGRIQTYLLYALVFIALVGVLTLFNLF